MSILRQLSRKLHGPRCHVTADEKLWVERRFLWLKDQFGSEPIRRAPLEPTPEFLPTKWHSSYTAGADLFNRLCTFMLLDPADINLHFYSSAECHKTDSPYAGEHRSSGPAGLYASGQNHQK